MAALQQSSPEEALVDKVLGAEQPTGRRISGMPHSLYVTLMQPVSRARNLLIIFFFLAPPPGPQGR